MKPETQFSMEEVPGKKNQLSKIWYILAYGFSRRHLLVQLLLPCSEDCWAVSKVLFGPQHRSGWLQRRLRGGGTMISVAPLWPFSSETSATRKSSCCLGSRSVAARAIIVNVFPRPIGSATIPPRNTCGSSKCTVPETLFTNLENAGLSHKRFLIMLGAETY